MFYTADKKVRVTQDNLEILDNYIESLQTIRKIAENCKSVNIHFQVDLDPFLEVKTFIFHNLNLFQLPEDYTNLAHLKYFHEELHKESKVFGYRLDDYLKSRSETQE